MCVPVVIWHSRLMNMSSVMSAAQACGTAVAAQYRIPSMIVSA